MAERFQWIDLENRAESFIAATLRHAAMAVCIGAHEGFGLPPLGGDGLRHQSLRLSRL